MRLIATGALNGGNVEELSERLGVTSRHLRRLFALHLGASPLAVAHTQRLHFAKRLVDDTKLSMSRIAMAAGFGSVRRFNDAFMNSYGCSPRELRKPETRGQHGEQSSELSLRLPFRRPFDWQGMLEFLLPRVTPGVEMVSRGIYSRTIAINGQQGIIRVGPATRPDCLSLKLVNVDTSALFEVVQRLRELFDLDAPAGQIASVLGADLGLRALVRKNPGLRVAGSWDGFELTVRAILGQQVSVKAATTLAGRIAARYGEPLREFGGHSSLTLLFPTAESLRKATFESIGLVQSRADTIRRVAGAVTAGDLSFDPAQDPVEFCAALRSIKGVGEWTAEYVAMRALKYPDAFPSTDLGLLKAFGQSERATPAVMRQSAEAWRPWRAYAAVLLWSSLAGSGG
jgi:AraC family transcriptional regulator of adaptative response / DNA-3-methyladenine glycosylase II